MLSVGFRTLTSDSRNRLAPIALSRSVRTLAGPALLRVRLAAHQPRQFAGDGAPCPDEAALVAVDLKATGLSRWQVLNPRFASAVSRRGRQKP